MDTAERDDGVTIRPERPEDADDIARVVEAAFDRPEVATLVADIRSSANFVPEWSLVAESNGSITGHTMVSFVGLVDGGTTRQVASLSPLAVAPEWQHRGIGSALVRAVIARVDAAGEPLIVLEGSPGFYGRLGFEYSVPLGIHVNLPDWAPPEAAQVRRLRAYDESIRGTVRYPRAFDATLE